VYAVNDEYKQITIVKLTIKIQDAK